MALPTALIAAPMNSGRFSAAQSRERTATAADPWKWGIDLPGEELVGRQRGLAVGPLVAP